MPNGISQFNKRPIKPGDDRKAAILMAVMIPLYLALFIWLHHKGLL